jgi:hypothetical protein
MVRRAPRQLKLPGDLLDDPPKADSLNRHRLPHHVSLIRLVQLIRLLETARSGWTYRWLADRFGVQPRTIRRDLETLRAAGAEIPVMTTPSGGTEPARVGRLKWVE